MTIDTTKTRPLGLTPEDNQNIDYIKRILSAIFGTVAKNKLSPIIAMTELLVYALSEGCKDQGDLNERVDIYNRTILAPTAKAIGTEFIKFFQELKEQERKNPGTMEAMSELIRANSDVQVRLIHPDEMESQPGINLGPGPITKH